MKLSKLTKKLLCTSLVAVGIVTNMIGMDAKALTVTGIGSYLIPLRSSKSITSTQLYKTDKYSVDGYYYNYYEAYNTYTDGYIENNYNPATGFNRQVYHAAYSIYNGSRNKVGSWDTF